MTLPIILNLTNRNQTEQRTKTLSAEEKLIDRERIPVSVLLVDEDRIRDSLITRHTLASSFSVSPQALGSSPRLVLLSPLSPLLG